MNIIGIITGSFTNVFGGLSKFVTGFFDKASKFDKDETLKISSGLKRDGAKYYKRDRFGTEIIYEYPAKDEMYRPE